ncbi:MAG: hypothetical protein HYS98_02890 [Deltaproteobacteria bacterium]|nr:hypothetical protein [Deltaproteobacteria bacterium]
MSDMNTNSSIVDLSQKRKTKGVDPKHLRRQKDIREFYQYIHANNLRKEALYLIDAHLYKTKIA